MNISSEVLTNQPICIDNGSGIIKAGFAGEERPKCAIHSFVGRPKHPRVMAGSLEGDSLIGPKAQEHRGLLKIRYPIEHGVVQHWDDMERIWHYIYSDCLKVAPEDHPILLTEAPLNPRKNRDQAAQIFFETFNTPAMFTSIQAILSLYASGRTTGIVLDSGDGVTHAVPVYEGFALPQAIRRSDLAGRDVTEYLQMLLRKTGVNLLSSAEKEIVRLIKEKVCYVSLDPKRDEREWRSGIGHNKSEQFRLPDGQIVQLGPERFRAPELLFNPELTGLENPRINQLVTDAINLVDRDLRAPLYSNILISGGSTMFKGFGDRLLNEIRKVAVKDTKIKIFAPPERKYCTWIGGSILASLSTFRKLWVSREEYKEDPDIIHRKCL